MCDLVKKSGGGARFFFREGGSIGKGGHVSSFERGGPLAWGVHWHGGAVVRSYLCRITTTIGQCYTPSFTYELHMQTVLSEFVFFHFVPIVWCIFHV